MRIVGLGALVVLVLGAGLVGPRGEGAAPASDVSYVSPAPHAPGPGRLSPPTDDPLPLMEGALIADGLDRPTTVVAAGPGRLFVGEKSGVIRVILDGEVLDDPLVDLDAEIPDAKTEQGLLSMALHPDFASNGLLYLHLTDAEGDVRIVEYRMSSDEPNRLDPDSARLIMWVHEPGQFHNGGAVRFGPEGHLFVSFGDGGFGEPERNARLPQNVLGTIVRIDVDAADPYAVPVDNPYVGTTFAPEVWVHGMRNPWRFWIDPVDRVLVIGDVGQFAWEEVTVLPLDEPGFDLGWPIMEADQCYWEEECDRAGLVLPAITYGHPPGCAVIAGPVYRGSAVPEMRGMVVYADYCNGMIRAFGMRDGHVVRHDDVVAAPGYGPLQSLGVDWDGEVLVLTQEGELRRLRPLGG